MSETREKLNQAATIIADLGRVRPDLVKWLRELADSDGLGPRPADSLAGPRCPRCDHDGCYDHDARQWLCPQCGVLLT